MTVSLVTDQIFAILPYAAAILSATKIIREDFPLNYFGPDYFNVSRLKKSHIRIHDTGLPIITLTPPVDFGAYSVGKPIDVYNRGKMSRNFTYIDDIVSGTITVLDADLPYGVMNIGGDRDEALMDYIGAIERYTGIEAKKKMLPMQPGDVPRTVADIRKLKKLGWKPTTRIEEGIKNFVDWYKEYYKIK